MLHKEFNTDRNVALNFLEANPLGTLATVDTRGIPNLALVYFFVESDFSCYFITKEKTRKLQNISERSVSSLLSASEDDLTAVELIGAAEIIGDTLEVVKIIERFQSLVQNRKAKYWVPPISQLEAGHYVVCRLIPHTVRMSVYQEEPAHQGEPQVHVFDLRG